MNKEKEKDKKILENLDRIVAGKKLGKEGDLDDETRATLELTRQMTSWSKSPPKEFRKQLKAQLIHKLAQEEKNSPDFDESRSEEFMRRHAWQFTVAAILVAIIAAIVYLIVNALQN